MRTATFEVPAELMADFSEKMTELELDNQIVGKNEYDEIIIAVNYSKEESSEVDELEEYLNKLTEEMEDEEEEEEEDHND